MPKKNSSWGTKSKVTESRERKAEKKQSEKEARERQVEDAKWVDNDKLLQKKQQKKTNEAQKKQEALDRKQEAKKLLEEEEAKNTSKPAKTTKPAVKKVTRSEIDQVKDKERMRLEEVARQQQMERLRITENPNMEGDNPNRVMQEMLEKEGAVEARNVDDAMVVLGKDDEPMEKSLRAAYNAYAEREMPRIRVENPGLRLSQWKQILWKEWQKSPENPLNNR